MADDAVLTEVRDRVLLMTLNRPEALNAHNQPMRDALVDALDRLDGDDGLAVGILRGAGRAFSAGADLKELAAAEDVAWPELARAARVRHFRRLEAVRKPLIAVVHGWVVGGGFELALCCDIRVAAQDARFSLPEPRTIGGVPTIAVHRLPRMVPAGEALRLLLTSQPIDAARAHAIGLVQEVAADVDSATETALGLAAQIVECDPRAVAVTKQLARWSLSADVAVSTRYQDALWPRGIQHQRPPQA